MRPLPYRLLGVAALLSSALLATPSASAQSERPSAMRLFPAETVLWVRTADGAQLVERLKETAYGQMLRDPDLQPLVDAAYATASDAYAESGRDLFDVELDDLLNLPAGEIAFGLVNRNDQGADPAFLAIADFGDQVQVAKQVFDRLQNLALEQGAGATLTTEQLRSDEATVVRQGNDQGDAVALVQRDATFVLCNDPVLMQRVLDRWDGLPIEELALEEEGTGEDESADEDDSAEDQSDSNPLAGVPYLKTLAENPSFSATLRELMPGGEEPPQALFFIDPVGMVQAIGGREIGSKIAMAAFPSLGLDGVKGFGAAMWMATDKWDTLVRGHLLLANPRSGAVKIARLETGETAPPDFVPADTENYLSARVDPVRIFEDVSLLYDKFQFEGAFRDLVEKRVSTPAGFDFEKEFVGNLDGSAFLFSAFDEERVRPGAQMNVALGVLDQAAAEATLAGFVERNRERYEEATFGAAKYYRFVPRPFRDVPPSERRFSPVNAVLDGHFLICQSEAVFKQLVQTRDGERARLNDSLQYRLVRSRLERLTEGRPFSALVYRDEEPALRHMHRLATSDEAREGMDRIAEFSPFVAAVRDTLEGAEVPPVEVLLRYASPSGGAMIDTETGWHMIAFSFKPTGK